MVTALTGSRICLDALHRPARDRRTALKSGERSDLAEAAGDDARLSAGVDECVELASALVQCLWRSQPSAQTTVGASNALLHLTSGP